MKYDSLHKTKARHAAKMIRAQLAVGRPDAGVELLRTWPELGVKTGCVAAYMPIHSEIDVLPLMRALVDAGHTLALPCIKRKAHPLDFRTYKIGDKLRRGAFGTREPLRDKLIVTPDIVLLPLLAFARNGYRLGYGGGFYDRTLAKLREQGEIIACGVAYSGQEVPILPTDKYDQKLDCVLTETGIKRYAS